jgi:hypothetical protein
MPKAKQGTAHQAALAQLIEQFDKLPAPGREEQITLPIEVTMDFRGWMLLLTAAKNNGMTISEVVSHCSAHSPEVCDLRNMDDEDEVEGDTA